ncbi:glycine--tRNA ligase subunit beta [Oceanobacillus chungangensis]|uniref:Glycine--tRNA ligase beta subunit n=1 Tax=Oceanobacillus chungangensis TaxID=1229152 RepID=A0A3D8Q3H6_9BACI|nr:glycine--tRNA ligase subunit beta [Oceanobacillus chungangensis]RDW21775.1 glycine--tRNA ligase subunit beta [Oceanobacillus chungangensis]
MAKNVIIEIGLEELPARFIDDAEKQFLDKAAKALTDLRISYESITSFSTPRRLAVQIQGVAELQTTIEEEAKGPAESIAKDADGNWTKAAIGFTRGQGKTPEDIYLKEIKGVNYIFVKKHIEGKPTIELLPVFKDIIESIQFGKNMRWGTETLKYARPIRWLVALYGSDVIPFEIARVHTSNKTFGHRFLGKEIILDNPEQYQSVLLENYVIADPDERERLILEGIHELEAKEGFTIPVDSKLLNEVRNLVEYPTVFLGSFEEEYLVLPSEVLITSMKEHQRYFPVITKEGKLLPHFIGVRNGDNQSIETVIRGNEKVLRARLADAKFFFEEDKKQSIDFYLEKLNRVVFQVKLGTIREKVDRVVHITKELTKLLGLDEGEQKLAIRAAEISKFDLMTNMVNEFTELQGVIGEKYATYFGEDPTVAKAISEHYLPRQANGELPETVVGAVVSIADKIDTIVGCISVGLKPTGSQDPYGLRRQATGILRILSDRKWNIPLEKISGITQTLYQTLTIEQAGEDEVTRDLHEFFQLRAAFLLKEMNIEQDVIQAVVHKEIGVFYYTEEKAKLLSTKRNEEAFKPIQEALVRLLNLANKIEEMDVNPSLFETDSERALFNQYEESAAEYIEASANKDTQLALSILSELSTPIHAFFDNNMVMAEDIQIRNNRLALINRIASLITDFADLSLIEWKQQF